MGSERPGGRREDINWPLLIALWVAISSNAAIIYLLWPKDAAVDFAVFWRAAQGGDVYAANAQPFVYPPTSLLAFAPLRLFPLWPAFLAWTAISIALFGHAAGRLYGWRAAALAIISPAIAVALIPGQTSLIAAAVLFAAFLWKASMWRGMLLGALLTFKPQLAVMAPLFLIAQRDWTAVAALIGAAVLLCALTTAVFGLQIWADWLNAIPEFRRIVADRGLSMSAVSPAAFAGTLNLPALPFLLLGAIIAVAMAAHSGRLDRREEPAMIAAASLLAAPYALRYDLVAIAPLMAAIILANSGRKGLIACAAYSASFGPLSLAAGAALPRWWDRRTDNPQPAERATSP